MDRGAWWATVHGVAVIDDWSDLHETHVKFHDLTWNCFSKVPTYLEPPPETWGLSYTWNIPHIHHSVSSVAESCLTLNPHGLQQTMLPVHHQLPELTQTHVHRVGDAIQPPHPLSSPSPPAHNLSQHQGRFKWVGSLHQMAKYWSFSFSISPPNEYSGLISFRMDCFHLFVVQDTLKSLIQYHRLKALIPLHSAFFTVHLLHLCLTAGKTITLTMQTMAK